MTTLMTGESDAEAMHHVFPGDGETARRMRSLDWSRTEIGHPSEWPENLRVAVSICLASPLPMQISWGAHLTLLYNDACIPYLAGGHPYLLGRAGRDSWNEIWGTAALLDQVRASGIAAFADDVVPRIDRPTAMRVSATPIRDIRNGSVDGVLCTFFESSARSPESVDAAERVAVADAKFRTMFEQGAQFAGMLSLDGRVIEVNRLALEACGFRREDVIGVPFWECGWWNRSAAIMEMVKEACERAARGHVFRREMTYFVADGSERCVHLIIAPVVDADGRVIFVAPTGVDVTEQRRAEESLRASERESERQRRVYEAILTNTLDLAYVFDLDHRFIYANERLLAMWGKTWEESIGRTCLELGYEPWHAAMHDREIEHVVATGQPIRGEVPFAGTFGPRIYDYIFVPVFGTDGDVEAVAGTTRDITDRKRAEEELRESRARLELALESAQIGDWDLDLVTDTSRRSLRHDRCFGYDEPLPEWGFARFLLHVHPDDRRAVEQQVAAAIDAAKDWHFECRVVWPDGSVHWIAVHAMVYQRDDGRATHMLGTVMDVTARTDAEQSMRRLADELAETNRRKSEFVAMLAHELRNPLAPIRNALQIVRRAEDDPDALRGAYALMDRQVDHMVRLVDDLLDLSRISRGRIEVRRERVELAAVIQETIETCRPAVDEARHELTLTLPTRPIHLDADAIRLAQVFSNLIHNSCKYSEPGGRIRLAADAQGSEVVVTVEDDGIGMAPETLPRIFEMFTQVDRSLDRSQGGLGIGLTLVKTLVEMHDGTVEAESAGLGHGSRFVVRLPIVKEAPPAQPARDPSPEPDRGRRRILVVDDNRDAADSLALLLRLRGNETQTAFDGLEAVEAAARFEPDVVLLDIGLPKLDGYDACVRIREQAGERRVVMIALTGWGQDEDRERSARAGFDAHLIKPLDHAIFNRVLASLLPDPDAG